MRSLNRVTNMVDAAGTTKYAYAAGGQLWTEDGPFSNDTVTNSYNNRLRTGLSLQQPTGKWTNLFAFDAAKRLTNVTSPAGSFAYTLGAASAASPLIRKIALPNSSYITNTYDSVARLTGTWLKNSTNGTLDSATYGYNLGHQRTTFTNAAGTYVQYTNDPIGQLKIANSSVNTEDRGYQYDAAWNLNYRTNNGVLSTFKVDPKNQLTNATPVGTQAYDGNGNVTSSQSGSATYTYDDENRLVSAQVTGSWKTDFVYDGLGRLRTRSEYTWLGGWYPSSPVTYTYDGMRVIQERGGSSVSYTRGSDLSGSLEGAGGIGGLLARSHGLSFGNWTIHNFYHADGNGNITYLVNSSQALAASYRYDPFGNTTASSGSLASANVYRFSSKEIHANSGLYYYGYRWYTPSQQRWPNRDPINELGHQTLAINESVQLNLEEEKNLYLFVRNSPPNLYDKDGRLVGYIIAGLAVAAYECAKPQVDKVWRDYRDSGDRFKHCWVSCRISKTCGAAFAQLAGISKEVRDRAVAEYCKSHPEADICDGGHGDFMDSIGDLMANQQCIGWESYAGPAGGWIGALCRRSCEDCCKSKVGYK